MAVNEIVSLITPSFNRATLVTETAESILAQTYPHWEWMIVDDGSTDNSWEVLEGLARRDSRIKIYKRNRGPKGACTCRNIAIEKSTGTYLIFLDTDDILAPFCLEQRVEAMRQQPEVDFIIFSMLLFKKKLDDTNLLWNIDKNGDELMRILLNDPVCQGTGTLWKKEKFVEIGMWREDLRIWQDMELHIRAFLWPVKFAKRMDLPPDVYLRISEDSLSRVGYHNLPKIRSRVAVYFYACERVKETGLMPVYRSALRKMACEIGLGIMYQRLFKEAHTFFNQIAPLEIFTKEEIRTIKTYLIGHQLRIDRINFVRRYFYNRVNVLFPETKDSVGVVEYKPENSLRYAV